MSLLQRIKNSLEGLPRTDKRESKAEDMQAVREEVYDEGCGVRDNEYFPKPFVVKTLKEKVREVLEDQ